MEGACFRRISEKREKCFKCFSAAATRYGQPRRPPGQWLPVRIARMARGREAAVCGRALAWALSLLLAALPFASARGQESLRVITAGVYPPFYEIAADGTRHGFEVDIAEAVCAALAIRCEYLEVSFAEVIPALLAGKGDAVLASLSITEERKRQVAFTNRYYRTPMRYLARRGFDRAITPDGLRGLRIGVTGDSTAESHVRRTLGGAVTVLLFPGDQNDLNRALIDRRVDLVLSDLLAMWQFATSPEGQDFEFVGQPIYIDEEIAIAVRKEDEGLRQKLNQAIARIRLDGTYQKINAKYFPFSIY
jgi:ABC-type amino acid transport substrate-binding protein